MGLLKYIRPSLYRRRKAQPGYYSQFGEDAVLAQYYGGKTNGFYVDIGAHDPWVYSNTAYFYERGWRGINIEPIKEGYEAFQHERGEDTNLRLGIGRESGSFSFYKFAIGAYNTFSKEVRDRHLESETCEYLGEETIEVKRLDEVLEEWMPKDTTITFMNIDVEGRDLDVLESNDWNRWRPELLLVEDWTVRSFEEMGESKIAKFLMDRDYTCFSKCYGTFIYKSI